MGQPSWVPFESTSTYPRKDDTLKTEMYYGEYFASVDEFYRAVDDYIFWYNNARLQQRFKGLTPMHYRNQTLEGPNRLELNQSNLWGLVQ
ncbi:integrase core domain-containing protein [Corynebacterium rouxii]|nr:integrase core domain-containing protein [Corynebacterium rouxii]